MIVGGYPHPLIFINNGVSSTKVCLTSSSPVNVSTTVSFSILKIRVKQIRTINFFFTSSSTPNHFQQSHPQISPPCTESLVCKSLVSGDTWISLQCSPPYNWPRCSYFYHTLDCSLLPTERKWYWHKGYRINVTLQWTGSVTNWCIMVDMAGSRTNGTRKRNPKTQTMAKAPRNKDV